MNTGRSLVAARRRAGLSQRALSARTGVAQPTIARIERGADNPRIGTLDRLFAACGEMIEALPQAGVGIDRSEIRALLALTPAQRAATLVDEARTLERFKTARRVD
jgi:transcriptional regulator with XRE-family HTH domain